MPYFDKRPYIREVEGLIRTSTFADATASQEPLILRGLLHHHKRGTAEHDPHG